MADGAAEMAKTKSEMSIKKRRRERKMRGIRGIWPAAKVDAIFRGGCDLLDREEFAFGKINM